MKKARIFIPAVMLAVILALTCPGGVCFAAKNGKGAVAREKYADFLANYSGQWRSVSFGLIDINNDKVPELIATPDEMYHMDIYAYVNGRVKEVYFLMRLQERRRLPVKRMITHRTSMKSVGRRCPPKSTRRM